MAQSFLILVTGQFRCSLKRTGDPDIRLFSNPEEAMAEVVRRFPNERAEVTISDMRTGATRRVVLEREKPVPEWSTTRPPVAYPAV